MISQRISQLGLAVLAGILVPAVSSAAIVISATAAPAVATPTNVSGSGAKANGPVELYVNGLSRGSVVADGSGNFTFTGVSIASTDVLRATASQVWNFNTAGDTEGWVGAGNVDTIAVAGGILSATTTAGGNVTLNLDPAGSTPAIVDTTLTRVFEMRYRIVGTYTGGGDTVIFDPGSGFQFGQNWNPSQTADFKTTIVDMTRAGGGASTFTSTGVSVQLAPGLNGMGAGAVLEVDYIRMNEYVDFAFNDAGDSMNLGVLNGTLNVTGGKAVVTSTIANTNSFLTGPFSEIDGSYFNTFRTRIQSDATNTSNLMTFQYLAGGGFPSGGFNQGWTVNPAANVATNIDLTGTPTFGSVWTTPATLNFGAGFFSPVFPNAAGVVSQIDFIRLTPATVFGPSAPVTVTLSSGVEDWTAF
jgi:hypothetical protein